MTMRATLRWAAIAVAAAGAAAVGAGQTPARQRDQGSRERDQGSRDIYGIGPATGAWMVAFSPEGEAAYETEAFERLLQAGATSVRLGFDWPALEPERGAYALAPMDAVVDRYCAHDITIYGMVVNTPAWASPTGRMEPGYAPTPEAMSAWEAFCEEMARRYRDRITFWEIWNEENGYGWNQDHGYNNVDEYLPLLQAGYRGLKAGNPDCVVGLGGLDDADGWGRLYIERLLAIDGGPWFEAVGDHPYSKEGDVDTTIQKLRWIVGALEPKGDDVPLWLTEYGWAVREIGEPDRVRCLHRFFEILRDPEFRCVKCAHYIGISDFEQPLDDFALCDVNLRPRPLFHAFQEEAARVRTGLPIQFRWETMGPGRVRLRWTTREPLRQAVVVTPDGGGGETRVEESEAATAHEIDVDGLAPGEPGTARVIPGEGDPPAWTPRYRVFSAAAGLGNAGFEGRFAAGIADGWRLDGRGIAREVDDTKPEDVHEGTQAQHIAMPRGQPLNDVLSQVIAVTPGERVRFRAWVRALDTGDDEPGWTELRAGLDPTPSADGPPSTATAWSDPVGADNEWHRLEATVEATGPVIRVCVQVRSDDRGGLRFVFFDDAEVLRPGSDLSIR